MRATPAVRHPRTSSYGRLAATALAAFAVVAALLTPATASATSSPFTTVPTPTISGSLHVGQTLTAVPGTWKPAATFTYEWRRDGAPIADADSSQYVLTSDDALHLVSVVVTGTRVSGDPTPVAKFSAAKTILGIVTPGLPSVTGAYTVGHKLTALPGAWAPAPVKFAYQWLRNGASISKATSSTYTLTSSDADKTITVRVTGSKTGYWSEKSTSADPAILVGRVLKPSSVKITGTPSLGQTLTGHPGTWGPAPVVLTTRWLRDGDPIDGTEGDGVTTGLQFSFAADDDLDVAHQFAYQVTITKPGYSPVTATSSPVTLGRPFDSTSAPEIDGTPTVGKILSLGIPAWSPWQDAFSFQWLRNGAAISGATSDHYTAKSADAGKTISVRMTGTKTEYTPTTLTSAGVKIGKAFTKSPTPTVTGTPTVGQKLTAHAGTWSPSKTTIKLQWFRDGTAIPGATKSTYTLVADDADCEVSVKVIATKSGYTQVIKQSAFHVIGLAYTATPAPVILGDPVLGAVLTSTSPAFLPGGVDFAYQWKRDGKTIATGGASQSYTVVSADLGHKLTVSATGHLEGYTDVTKTSASVKAGALPFGTAPAPSITGVYSQTGTLWPINSSGQTVSGAVIGHKLTGVVGTWAPTSGTTKTYAWLRDGVPISGATKTTYTPTTTDAGHQLAFRVTTAKTGYATTSRTSDPVPAGKLYATTPSVTLSGTPPFQGGQHPVADDVITFTTHDVDPAASVSFVWGYYPDYGTTFAPLPDLGTSHTVTAAEFDCIIAVRVYIEKPGYLPVMIATYVPWGNT